MNKSFGNVKVDVYGLNELKDIIKAPSKAASNRIAANIASIVLPINDVIRQSVRNSYTVTQQEFERVRVAKARSLSTQGKNLMEVGLMYEILPRRLINQYTYSPVFGNINSWATRKGWITSSYTKRGQKGINYGKLHYGGYYQKAGNSNSRISSFDDKINLKSNIFERQQKATWIAKGERAPVTILFAPTIASLIVNKLNEKNTAITKAIADAELKLLELI